MELISRKDAKAQGLRYYFTGAPCKRGGHIDQRFVSSFMCRSCGREKALQRYHGLEGADREATHVAARVRSKRWNAEHREEQRPKFAAYRKTAKEQKPDYFKQHYSTNKERRKRESNEWYRANRERALENRKEYVAANREKARVWGRKSANTRRAITKRVFVEVVDPRVVFERDTGMCGICLKPVDPKSPWEVDHVIPISKGGPHSYANVQLSHRACNRSKSARLPEAAA